MTKRPTMEQRFLHELKLVDCGLRSWEAYQILFRLMDQQEAEIEALNTKLAKTTEVLGHTRIDYALLAQKVEHMNHVLSELPVTLEQRIKELEEQLANVTEVLAHLTTPKYPGIWGTSVGIKEF